ncbi:hypothetical protein [Leptospira interrogans]|uniref:hypothetical protein n=1 Tax=Leptospira interrogans TaxID=173 RepID=UPI0005C7921D|nr:hypothetical protein [Leptospira interrogans]UMQ59615.1 hypothetical protein FH585_07765 [Leptospira interrogans]UNE68536.1 hypothetical protein FH588_10110 [Leptospira interrogans]
MISNLGSQIKFLSKPATYQIPTEGYVEGEFGLSYGPEIPIKLVILPVRGLDRKNTSQGEYSQEDKVILEMSKVPTFKNKYKINYLDVSYEIGPIIDYGKDFNFIKYLAKRLPA